MKKFSLYIILTFIGFSLMAQKELTLPDAVMNSATLRLVLKAMAASMVPESMSSAVQRSANA